MAFWDLDKKIIILLPPKKSKRGPGWWKIDCGCCNGIKWGGETPRECSACDGTGVIYKHKKSYVLAKWPGGPFLGRGYIVR